MNKQIDMVFRVAGLNVDFRMGHITQDEYDKRFEKLMDELYDKKR